MPADSGGAAPRFAPIDRQQLVLRPVVVEALIPADHPARAIWAFVGQLDLARYYAQVRVVDGGAGRSATDPHLLVSLWVYSYSRGVSSARAIARLCEDDPAYQWLTGLGELSGPHVVGFSHRARRGAAGSVCAGAGRVDGGRIDHAGAGDAGRDESAGQCGVDGVSSPARIERLLAEAHAIVDGLDQEDATTRGARQRAAHIRAAHDRQRRLEAAQQEFTKLAAAQSTVERVSTTDPDARIRKQADGATAPNYNVQITTDAAHGIIVDIDVTQAGSDYQQLTPALLATSWSMAGTSAVTPLWRRRHAASI